ncbi:MAG: acyl-CoA reductase [Bacteroidota bacterium]
MTLRDRIQNLVQLGERLGPDNEFLEAILKRTEYRNGWFTLENQRNAIEAIRSHFLQAAMLEDWVSHYDLLPESSDQKVGLVMAGNIPLVGFHDWMCIYLGGYQCKVKLSEKDPFLFPYLIKLMEEIDPHNAGQTQFIEKLTGFDAVIATGSNNSARYFEAYFAKYPSIIRKNRHAVAVLTGEETADDIQDLGNDIFQYFGLGCRNVSKLYLPEGYDLQPMLEGLHEFRQVMLHQKYKNNFDYNYSILELNRTPYYNNGCLIMIEEPSLHSRIACMHFSYYQALPTLGQELVQAQEEIQCVVSKGQKLPVENLAQVGFGQAQKPALDDYTDGVDTLAFLAGLGA